jgi:hypothetical protein
LKIGILTIYKVLNYGAVLQTYALQKVLQEQGHNVFIVNYQPNELTKPYKTVIIKKLKNIQYVLRLWRRIFLFYPFKKFVKNFLNEGTYYSSFEQLKKMPPEADVFIVGSDQVWNDKLTGKNDVFFLPFLKKCKKISYAASCGGNYTFLEDYLKLNSLEQFNAISVREKSLQIELKRKNISADAVLDPTLLLEDYSEFVQKNIYGSYIVVYNIVLSKDFKEKLAYLKKKTNLPVINIGPHFLRIADKNLLGISPSMWVTLLFHAQYVFTNSFHGIAFSIIFKKRFLYIPTGTNADSRVLDILMETELNDHIGNDLNDINKIVSLKENPAENKKIVGMRVASLNFLTRAIDGKNN